MPAAQPVYPGQTTLSAAPEPRGYGSILPPHLHCPPPLGLCPRCAPGLPGPIPAFSLQRGPHFLLRGAYSLHWPWGSTKSDPSTTHRFHLDSPLVHSSDHCTSLSGPGTKEQPSLLLPTRVFTSRHLPGLGLSSSVLAHHLRPQTTFPSLLH